MTPSKQSQDGTLSSIITLFEFHPDSVFEFHPDSVCKRSSKTCMKLISAECK